MEFIKISELFAGSRFDLPSAADLDAIAEEERIREATKFGRSQAIGPALTRSGTKPVSYR